MYRIKILCPPLPPVNDYNDYKACLLDRRPVFLRIDGGRLEEEGFLKGVRVDNRCSLYKGTWLLIRATLDLIRKERIRVIPLAETETGTGKPITEKQRRLLIALMEELGEKHPIPATRRDASELIDKLKLRKRVMKKRKRTIGARRCS